MGRHRTQAVTLSDVARRAGVSVATASKALNDRAQVAAATRQRVLQAASELSFQPNALARGLIVRPHPDHRPAHRRARRPVLHPDPARRRERARQRADVGAALRRPRRRDPPPALHPHAAGPPGRRLHRARRQQRHPAVADPRHPGAGGLRLRRVRPTRATSRCSPTTRAAPAWRWSTWSRSAAGGSRTSPARTATGRPATGSRACAPCSPSTASRWPAANRSTASGRSAGAGTRPGCCSAPTPRSTRSSAATTRSPPASSQTLLDLGRRIPDDVAIVGYDNWEDFATDCRPPLTTVDLNLEQLGATAVEHLFAALDGTPSAGVVRQPCRLVIRESTVPATAPQPRTAVN